MIAGIDRLIRPPRLGVIGLGKKVPNAGTPLPHTCDPGGICKACHPVEVPYFVLDKAPELQALFRNGQADGRELPGPTVLADVRFPYNDIARVLHDISYEKRQGKMLTRKCDGRECVVIPLEGRQSIEACAKDQNDIYKPCPQGCRAGAKLLITVPRARVGVYQLTLGGLQRIADLMSELGVFKMLFGDRLTGIPFDLERVPTIEQYRTKEGKRSSRTGYPIHIRCNVTAAQASALTGGDIVQVQRALEEAKAPGDATTIDDAQRYHDVLPEAEEGSDGERGGDDHWTIEDCFRAAKLVEASAHLYERYLTGHYRKSVDELSMDGKALDEERTKLAKAAADPDYARVLLGEMAGVANLSRRPR